MNQPFAVSFGLCHCTLTAKLIILDLLDFPKNLTIFNVQILVHEQIVNNIEIDSLKNIVSTYRRLGRFGVGAFFGWDVVGVLDVLRLWAFCIWDVFELGAFCSHSLT